MHRRLREMAARWGIWLIAPTLLALMPFLIRFTLLRFHWYFFANIGITATLILWVWASRSRGVWWGVLALEIPITFLSTVEILTDPWLQVRWAVDFNKRILDDGGVRGTIGIVHAAVGLYVFRLGVRSLKNLPEDKKELDELIQDFRSVLGLSALFSLIVALGVFAIQSAYPITWTIRPGLLIAGFVVGAFAISLGVILGHSKNPLLLMVGGLLISALAFILGAAVMSFTITSPGTTSPAVYIAQVTFFTNILLATGVVSVMVSDPLCPLNSLVKRLLS